MSSIQHPAGFLWRGLIRPLFGWIVLVPLAILIPKRRGLVLFIGLPRAFSDNVKYVYLTAMSSPEPNLKPVFLADSPDLAAQLTRHSLPFVMAGTFESIWTQLRASVVVADTVAWVRPIRFHAMYRARRVQLWHGCPLKRIERHDAHLFGSGAPWHLRLMHALSGRFAEIDLLLSPSPLFTHLSFSGAFCAKTIVEDNYPRNDVFWRDDERFQIGVDREVATRIEEATRDNLRLVLYMPTFRDGGGNAVSDGALDLAALQRHAETERLLYVFKMHPVDASRIDARGFTRIVQYRAGGDVYPLLRRFNVLVTDYSSVFFDFLHGDRPLVFFPYDFDRYTSRDRGLYLDYENAVPGPIARNQADLQRTVVEQIATGGDRHQSARRELRGRAFSGRDGRASERIWSRIAELARR